VRTLLTTALLAVLVATPAAADLHYTTHITTRKAESTAPIDPMMGMIGAMLVSRFPTGDMAMTVSESGTRVEFVNALGPVPAGGVLLLRPTSAVILNPANHTYWMAPAPRTPLPGGAGAPTVNSRRTGEFSTVAGLRAERVTFDLSMNLPLPPGVQAPAGFPTAFTLDGEMWVADQFKAYTASLNGIANTLFPGIGIGGIAPDGLVVQQVMRSPMFGGSELVFSVSDVTETPANAALFEIPSDYKETPPPSARRGPGAGGQAPR
jgi:hypothetical protein